MPVIVITPSRANPTAVRKYIMRKDKTNNELKFSHGCEPDSFERDFRLVQGAYDKCNLAHNIKYYHFKISWHPEDNVFPCEAKEMLMEFCRQTNLVGCQYAGSVHTDSGKIHGHIVVNNVRLYDSEYGKSGHCYAQSPKCRRDMMAIMNDITLDYGYTHSIVDYSRHAKERLSYGEKELIKKGVMPWKEELKMQIQSSIKHSNSIEEFKQHMFDNYHVHIDEKKEHFTYFTEAMQSQDRGCPARRLGDAYDKELLDLTIEREPSVSIDMH